MKRGHMPTQCRHTHEITEQSFDLVLSGMPASTTGSTKTTVLWMASTRIIPQPACVWGYSPRIIIDVARAARTDAWCKNRFMPPLPDRAVQPHNPLHGLTLEAIVTALVAHYGWADLGARIPVRCFVSDPSVASSLKFLRKTAWAREKVESLYLFMLREQRRAAR